MNQLNIKKLLPFALISSFMLSGCNEKSECQIPSRHVHKYTKEINDDIAISKYLDNEHLSSFGYNWNEDYIEITKDDESFYDVISGLFDGIANWNYLYHVMSTHHDYLEFYYEYITTEVYTTTDSDGKTTTHTRTVHHDGWTTNPYDSDNTGKTRLAHHRYYGFRVINKDGKFKLEKSNAVDDIREIINDYNYFKEDCTTIVYEYYKYSRFELPYLNASDFDRFEQPDLSNPNINLDVVKTKVKTK